MCHAMEYYSILDDVQLKLLFLTSSPTDCQVRSEKFWTSAIFLKHTVLRLFLENKKENLKLAMDPTTQLLSEK